MIINIYQPTGYLSTIYYQLYFASEFHRQLVRFLSAPTARGWQTALWPWDADPDQSTQ